MEQLLWIGERLKKYICIAQANVGMHKVTLHEGLQLLVCLWAEVNCMWQLQVYR